MKHGPSAHEELPVIVMQDPGTAQARSESDDQAVDPAERLQACAASQKGTPEEAVALFAAVLRSQSLLVRIVR